MQISVPGKITITEDESNTVMRKASLRPDTQQGAESTIASSRPSTRNTTIKDGIIIRWENDTRPLLRRPRTSSMFLTRSECSSCSLFPPFFVFTSMHKPLLQLKWETKLLHL